MKKINVLFLAAIITMIADGLTSCEKENEDDWIIIDFAPVIFYIDITNQNGDNLLNDCSPEFYKSFSIFYDGQKYQPEAFDLNTRSYKPYFFGMRYETAENSENSFSFGEFSGSNCNVNFTFTMPNGKAHDISLIRKATSKGSEIAVDQTLKIDDMVITEYTDGNPNILMTFTYEPN